MMADDDNPTIVDVKDRVFEALVQPETLAALLARMDADEAPLESADPLEQAFLDAVDQRIRKRIGPLPWVRRTLAGQVLSVGTRTCTVRVAGIDQPVTDVLFGPNKPQVGDVYPVRFPVTLPPEGVPLIHGPVPYGNPWIKVPGGGFAFYYSLTSSDGHTLGVFRVPWPPVLQPGDVLEPELLFQVTGPESLQLLGVDGTGQAWVMLFTGGTASIRPYAPLAGSLTWAAVTTAITLPAHTVALAVDMTPGQQYLLAVSTIALAPIEDAEVQAWEPSPPGFLPPTPATTYTFPVESEPVRVQVLVSNNGAGWLSGAGVTTEGPPLFDNGVLWDNGFHAQFNGKAGWAGREGTPSPNPAFLGVKGHYKAFVGVETLNANIATGFIWSETDPTPTPFAAYGIGHYSDPDWPLHPLDPTGPGRTAAAPIPPRPMHLLTLESDEALRTQPAAWALRLLAAGPNPTELDPHGRRLVGWWGPEPVTAAGAQGVFISHDDGRTWLPFPEASTAAQFATEAGTVIAQSRDVSQLLTYGPGDQLWYTEAAGLPVEETSSWHPVGWLTPTSFPLPAEGDWHTNELRGFVVET